MAIAGAAMIAGGVLQGVLGSGAAHKAAQAQIDALDQGAKFETNAWADIAPKYKPYMDTGVGANNALSDLYGINGADKQTTARNNFQFSPDYQFAFTQGLKAIDSGAASRGVLNSGGTIKSEQAYGSGLATQNYNNYLSGLVGLANRGLTATSGYGNTESHIVDQINSDWQGIGAARAGGVVNANNAWMSGINNAIGGISGIGGGGGASGINSLIGGLGSAPQSSGAGSSYGVIP